MSLLAGSNHGPDTLFHTPTDAREDRFSRPSVLLFPALCSRALALPPVLSNLERGFERKRQRMNDQRQGDGRGEKIGPRRHQERPDASPPGLRTLRPWV